ncbi:MAG: cyclodeaminase/cyclohydrolase family protein [Coriobacteriales bacterium]|nr:cyclodeaminase/cyclohydrolase family protein [Coriobacteriales bacterium]
MNTTELSCSEFITLLASDAPAPGGGGAAALVGAIGTALGTMVGSLTLGKPKFADVEVELRQLKERADVLQDHFIELVARDAEVFLPLSQAYGLPKATEEEAARKAEVMEACLTQCAAVPLEIMQASGEALELLERLEQIGTPIALSDIGCGALTLKAALCSADLNVRVNTRLLQDRARADALNAEAEALLVAYTAVADRIYQRVQARYI